MPQGSCQDSLLITKKNAALGPRPGDPAPWGMSLEPWALSLEPRASGHEPWAMRHEQWTVNNRLIAYLSIPNLQKIKFLGALSIFRFRYYKISILFFKLFVFLELCWVILQGRWHLQQSQNFEDMFFSGPQSVKIRGSVQAMKRRMAENTWDTLIQFLKSLNLRWI